MAGSVLFRVDASAAIGAGHAGRCLALGQALAERGARVTFALAESLPGTDRALAADGFAVERIAAAPGGREDVTATAALARRHSIGAIVLDGPAFAGAYQDGLARAGFPLVMLDDNGALAPYRARLIVNPNPHAVKTLYPRHAEALCGLKYVALRREFRHRPKPPEPPRDTVQRVIVTLGSSDSAGATARVLAAFQAIPPAGLQLGVVVGGGNPNGAAIEAAAKGSPHQVFVRHDLADMAAAMASADLAVSAAGSTLWELAFMGVPTLALVAAEGQRPAAAAYGAAGLGDVIDLLAADGEARLGPAIATLLGDAERRRTIAARGRAAVDGQGAARVCQRIEALLLKARAQA